MRRPCVHGGTISGIETIGALASAPLESRRLGHRAHRGGSRLPGPVRRDHVAVLASALVWRIKSVPERGRAGRLGARPRTCGQQVPS
jgi:hypothetical protein